MNIILLLASILMVLFIAPINAIAQESSTPDSTVLSRPEEKSYGLVGTNYSSDLIFLGRKSSAKTPYLSVATGYYHKSGLFINGGASYLASSGERGLIYLREQQAMISI